jgi:hypothetical protein
VQAASALVADAFWQTRCSGAQLLANCIPILRELQSDYEELIGGSIPIFGNFPTDLNNQNVPLSIKWLHGRVMPYFT